jgi:selenocysteine lyase/cysteine desulfurase
VAADDIRKLNHTGTHPEHTPLTISRAIEFHESIGSARKEARLRFLQQYWTSQLRGRRGIVLSSPSDPARCCAIATVGVERLSPAQLAESLLREYRVYTVAIDSAGIRGVRVTPQVFTSTTELDVLVRALRELSA